MWCVLGVLRIHVDCLYIQKRIMKRLYYRALESIADVAELIATKLNGIAEQSYIEAPRR